MFGAFFEEFGELDVFGPANLDEGMRELDDFVDAEDDLALRGWWLDGLSRNRFELEFFLPRSAGFERVEHVGFTSPYLAGERAVRAVCLSEFLPLVLPLGELLDVPDEQPAVCFFFGFDPVKFFFELAVAIANGVVQLDVIRLGPREERRQAEC